VSYHPSFSGRTRVDQAFAARHLKPDIVLEAIDADVIKTYVKLGLGIGIVAEWRLATSRRRRTGLAPVGHLFGQNVTRIASSAARTCATSSTPSPRRRRSG
jgi:LysR family cys regulon transcriptional activator